jgi:hypothetical protein
MSPPEAAPLPLGATIGILGGGQLGRMSAMAAARLGYRTHVYAPEADSPGMQVATAHTVASYEDVEALRRFAAQVDVVTFEFENVPAAALAALEGLAPCRPGLSVLATCQDRLAEKAFLEAAGVPVAPWAAVRSAADLDEALTRIGLPAVLKTTRLGYDGRGQAVIHAPEEAAAAYARLAPKPLVLEAFVPFIAEVSAIAARGADGALAVFDAVENRHRHHILDLSVAGGGGRDGARPCGAGGGGAGRGGRARARDVPAGRRDSARQRDRAAPAQLRALDDGRLRLRAVRAAHPRRGGAAARARGAAGGCGDAQSGGAGGPGRLAPPRRRPRGGRALVR